MSPSRAFGWTVLVLAGAVFAVQATQFGLCLQDDTFISLRFARNLAEGHGLVYNAGERVEGYTNFLWTAGLALPFVVGLDAVWFARWAGIASGVLLLLGVLRLGRAVWPDARGESGAVAALLAAGLPFVVAEAVMGLETALFAALVAWGLAFVLEERATPARFPWSGVVFALAVLTRPEGIFVAGLVGLDELRLLRRDRAYLRPLVRRWSPVLFVAVAHVALRWMYYGDVVPNTFHAKVGGGWLAWQRGLAHAGEFASATPPLVGLALAGALLAARRRSGKAASAGALLVAFVAAAYVGYVTYVGGDYKPTFRFFAVPAVLLAVLAGGALVEVGALLAPRWRQAVSAGLAIVTVAMSIGLGTATREFVAWRRDAVPVHRAAGAWLGEHFPADTLIATGNAGALPFESRLPTIDMLGLCDRHIALREMPDMGRGVPGHEKGDGAYVLDRAPRIILLQNARFSLAPLGLSEAHAAVLTVAEYEVWEDPRFLTEYELKAAQLPGFTFNYFERKAR